MKYGTKQVIFLDSPRAMHWVNYTIYSYILNHETTLPLKYQTYFKNVTKYFNIQTLQLSFFTY